jgi:flagellar protein FlbT
VIEGASPILREKDILTPAKADTPAKRIYLAVQLMYTSRDPRNHHDVYFALVRQIVQAAPSTWSFVESINNQILTGNTYKALKEAKKLIAYEEGLLQNAKRGAGLQKRSKANLKSAGA